MTETFDYFFHTYLEFCKQQEELMEVLEKESTRINSAEIYLKEILKFDLIKSYMELMKFTKKLWSKLLYRSSMDKADFEAWNKLISESYQKYSVSKLQEIKTQMNALQIENDILKLELNKIIFNSPVRDNDKIKILISKSLEKNRKKVELNKSQNNASNLNNSFTSSTSRQKKRLNSKGIFISSRKKPTDGDKKEFNQEKSNANNTSFNKGSNTNLNLVLTEVNDSHRKKSLLIDKNNFNEFSTIPIAQYSYNSVSNNPQYYNNQNIKATNAGCVPPGTSYDPKVFSYSTLDNGYISSTNKNLAEAVFNKYKDENKFYSSTIINAGNNTDYFNHKDDNDPKKKVFYRRYYNYNYQPTNTHTQTHQNISNIANNTHYNSIPNNFDFKNTNNIYSSYPQAHLSGNSLSNIYNNYGNVNFLKNESNITTVSNLTSSLNTNNNYSYYQQNPNGKSNASYINSNINNNFNTYSKTNNDILYKDFSTISYIAKDSQNNQYTTSTIKPQHNPNITIKQSCDIKLPDKQPEIGNKAYTSPNETNQAENNLYKENKESKEFKGNFVLKA